jgi:hypothetical protein
MSQVITNSINALCTHLNSKLGETYPVSFKGRAEKMLRRDDVRGLNRLLPILENVTKDNDYEILMPDDRSKPFGFVYVEDTINIEDFDLELNATYDVRGAIIVTGKLDDLPKLTGNSSKVYSFRYFMDEVVKALFDFKEIEVVSVSDSTPDVYEPFTIDKETHRYFYYPFFAFRINFNLEVDYKTPC